MPDFLGPFFQIYSDETHNIVIRIQQGAGRFGENMGDKGDSPSLEEHGPISGRRLFVALLIAYQKKQD